MPRGIVTWLDPSAEHPRWGLAETLGMGLWLLAAGFAVHQHVPWADEEQAWLLATGVGWKMLFLHSLHYEGTGGLWHAYLKILAALGLSFTGARWVTLLVEGAGMAVLLGWSPLPRAVRWLLPFSFFLLYQDGVVARSYCLFALPAFAAAALLRRGGAPRAKAVWFSLLLGLMANISLHGALASAGLAFAAAVRWRGQWLRNWAAMALLLALWAAAAATMAPAHDIDFSAGQNIDRSVARIEKSLGMHVSPPPPLSHAWMAGLPPTPAPVHYRPPLASAWNKLERLLAVVQFPLARSRVLALACVLSVLLQAWFARRVPAQEGSLGFAGLAPYGLLVAVFTSMYLAPRHVGVLFTAFVVSLWLTWPEAENPAGPTALRIPHRTRVLGRLTAALLVLVCALQAAWTVHAVLAEHAGPYGPGQMSASYLRAQGAGLDAGPTPRSSIAGYYYGSIDPLLYFNRNLYENQPPHRYWLWSLAMRDYGPLGTVQAVLRARPRWIVVGGYASGPDAEVTRDWFAETPAQPGVVLHDEFGVVPFFTTHGYRVTHVFCGHSWMRDSYAEQLCDTVLEPR